jgi:uncharacterized protein YecE (DUF72 family)
VPGGDRQVQYLRLHGSPRMYYDSYSEQAIQRVATCMQQPAAADTQRWCIFDNTAHGHGTGNALALLTRLQAR